MQPDDCIAPGWPAPEGIVAGCTTRIGGVSQGVYRSLNLGAHVGDDPAAVSRNRRLLMTALDLPGEPAWLNQVHGTSVVVDPEPQAEADAAVTRNQGHVCVVMVADCLPVLFCNDGGTAVAAAHAGWRGLAAGVLENTVAAMDAPPARVHAWLGPAISQDAFEVGDDVRDAFLARDKDAASYFERNAKDRWQADLFGLARRRLEAVGVRSVSGGGLCTYGDPERFFSFRRDGQCGRMAAYIFRTP